MKFDPKKVAEWLHEQTEEEAYEEDCREQERMAQLTEEEWIKEVEEMFADEDPIDAEYPDAEAAAVLAENDGEVPA